ncbi:Outer membrane efflux protein [Rosistilla carotiformis]|uniref:Outer membrane efflux protein n=1 Tax=Rosistilla carotiformis TaxID=2528017 RepID=A0A518K1K4_9BACT|nr:Outer membrane efflux protein [Rosistilla carotiformis]
MESPRPPVRIASIALCCVLVACCAAAWGDDLGIDESLITPRSLYRNNPARTVDKGAPRQRDHRFTVESGLVKVPRGEAAAVSESDAAEPLASGASVSLSQPNLPATSSRVESAPPVVREPQGSPLASGRPSSATVDRKPNHARSEATTPSAGRTGATPQISTLHFPVTQRLVAPVALPVMSRDLVGESPAAGSVPLSLSMDTTLQLSAPALQPAAPIPLARDPMLADPNFDAQRFSITQIIESAKTTSILTDRPAVMLSVNDLLARTLFNSKTVKILRIQPVEDRQVVDQEFGQFDWATFFENRLLHNNTPVNQLNQAGIGQTLIRGDDLQFQAGMRKQTTTGGEIEVRESIRFLDDNSGRLQPSDQAISALSLVYSQELLRDGGRDVVLSQALVASYQADQSQAESVALISSRLQEVLNQYWTLFENRGNYYVQLALTRWAHETLMQLESRRRIDAQENTIEQARALLLEAKADLVDAEVQVRIAQDQLFRLVNDPALDPEHVEIITTHPPLIGSVLFEPRTELSAALQNRGEVYERIAAISEAAVQHHVSLNQLLPRLTVSLESSLNGIEGQRNLFGAKANGLETSPTIEANFNLEFFLSNRAARATNRQTQLALRRLQLEYEDTIEQVRLDVSESIRTLNASADVLDLRSRTLQARRTELDYLRLRRDVIPQADASVSLLLEQFFQALARLVTSQQSYLQAVGNQQRALADLQRAKGMLIHSSEVPGDAFVPVPTIPQALKTQLRGKGELRTDIDRSVIQPGVKRRWQHQATLQAPTVLSR